MIYTLLQISFTNGEIQSFKYSLHTVLLKDVHIL